MAKKETFLQASSVRALAAFVSILWIVGIAGLIMYAGLGLISFVKSLSGKEEGLFTTGGLYLAGLLTACIFLWIIYNLKKLLKTVDQGNPFEKDNPGRIRRIAYGVYVLIPLQIFSKLIMIGFSEAAKTGNFVDLLLRDLMMPVFLGTAILVIARVFETGVRLQQDQSLTI
jgi:uncharacterized membrane protein